MGIIFRICAISKVLGCLLYDATKTTHGMMVNLIRTLQKVSSCYMGMLLQLKRYLVLST